MGGGRREGEGVCARAHARGTDSEEKEGVVRDSVRETERQTDRQRGWGRGGGERGVMGQKAR